jgi:SAM-dependent methyltransferase
MALNVTSVLEYPAVYLTYQALVGGIRARKRCIRDHVKPTKNLTVLDVGCGPGYTIECFPQPTYFGFDISQEYISYAKRKFSPPGQFYCQYLDESILSRLPKADVVLLMGLVHHMDDSSVVELFHLVNRAMKPGGRLYTLDGCYQQDQARAARYFLDNDRGKYIRDESGYRALAAKVFPQVTSVIREDLFRIPYTALIMECVGGDLESPS